MRHFPKTKHPSGILFSSVFKISMLLLFVLFANSLLAQWTQKANALRKRAECPSILYNGKIYVFGGFGEHPDFEKDNEVYDPATDTWSLIASFPTGKEISHQGFVLVDDKIWHIGGRAVNADGPVSSQVIIYNITTNTWSDGPALRDPATGQLLTLGGGGAVLLGRTLHVFGGFAPTICIDQSKYHLTLDVDKWMADPINTTWQNTLAPMPIPRNHVSSVVLGGKIYALGGQFSHDCGGVDQVYCHVYDPVANTWTRLTDIPSPRSHTEMGCFAVDGKIYLVGGQGPSGVAQNTVLAFNPSTNGGLGSWSTMSALTLPNNYYGISSKVVGNAIIISHGALDNVTNERIETYSAPFTRTAVKQLGFSIPCFTQYTGTQNPVKLKNLLYTVEESTTYSASANVNWITVTKNVTGTALKTGNEIEITIDPSGLAEGSYSGQVSAVSTGISGFNTASFCVNITVSSATPSITVTTVGNGTVTKSPDQSTYAPGTSVTLTAAPTFGSNFTGWTGDTTSGANPIVIKLGTSNKAFAANFVAQLISNISTGSGKTYTLSTVAQGNSVYIDRNYIFTSVPSILQNAQFIRTANDDKTNTSANFLSFDLSKNSMVYVAYDPRGTTLPSWMSGWTKISDKLGFNDANITAFDLYQKSFAAGHYTLGGNLASPASGAMTNYIVIAKENNTTTPSYSLSVNTTGTGTVSKNPEQQTYLEGSVVTITATPGQGQQFAGWSGDASGTTNPLDITMSSNKTITASFIPVQTSQLITNITPSSSRSYVHGTMTTGVQYHTDRNYTITSLPSYLNGAEMIRTANDDKTNTSTNLLNFTLSQDAIVYVAYDPRATSLPAWLSNWQKLSDKIGVTDKIVNADIYSKSFPKGIVTLGGNLASPAAGAMTGYYVAALPSSQPIDYKLSLSVSGNGSVTKNPNQSTYTSGTNVSLSAVPESGYQFSNWSGDATGSANPLNVTMDGDKTISAVFVPVSGGPLVSNVVINTGKAFALGNLSVGVRYYSDRNYTVQSVPQSLDNEIYIQMPNNDKANKSADYLSFTLGQSATVYVAYDPRETSLPAWLNGWTKSSEVIGISDPKITSMEVYYKTFPAGSVVLGGNLVAPAAGAQNNYFIVVKPSAAVQYTLTTSIVGSGSIAKNPDQANYTSGSSVSLTATPSSGEQFLGWAGDASGTTNPLTVIMNANKSITANFSSSTNRIVFASSAQSVDVQQGGSATLLDYISTSNQQPTSAKLYAKDNGGQLPTWISVNGNLLNGTNYTTGSEITFSFDATNLSVGSYLSSVYADAVGYKSDTLRITLNVQTGGGGTQLSYQVNFQDSTTTVPAGWLRDYGQPFGARNSANQGTGNVYGWLKKSNLTPLDLTKNTRNRGTPSDVKLATLMHMQAADVAPTTMTTDEGVWEIQVANGNYDVTVSVGDGSYTNSVHTINVEGVNAIAGFVPTSAVKFKQALVTVTVSDGLLTIDATGGTNTKIDYIKIDPASGSRPSVVAVSPDNGAQQVSENTSISTSILNLPNGGIDNSTINPNNVYLTEQATGNLVLSNVNGTGGGDAITLVPSNLLKLNTTYVFHITNGVKDLTGASFISYSSTFTTGTGSSGNVLNAKFDQIALPNATGRHSTLKIGPDGKLYALSIDGLIKRFPINTDGTLGKPDSLYVLQDAYGPRTPRLAIGLTFDPASTANNLIAYVTHSTFVFLNGPEWDGKLTRLSGPNLGTVQDLLVKLPRSAKDHLTNSVAFGPDGALYFTQGSLSAMGKADQTWGNRNESLLSGAVLRLDLTKLPATLPLNVLTTDGGGSYNPYGVNAPLTIYGSGVRNAYDLLWHTNGNLYCPTNGSAAGGNTPASVPGTLRPDGTTYNGPAIPSLMNVQQTQKDFLFKVVKGGYYGHPNPTRGQYAMNGANPTAYPDPAEVTSYPVETNPDANYRGYAFDFQNNKSPNGVIEYRNNAFNGALKGKILVVRYSQNDDILTLTPGSTGDIISSVDGAYVEGFSGFVDPLDLIEDTLKGNIYVSEYGGDGKITLLRVKSTTPPTVPNTNNDNLTADQVSSEDVLDSLLVSGTPKAYPNPFRTKFMLEFPADFDGTYDLKLSDVSGKTINLGSVTLNGGGSKMEMDLAKYNIVKGVYFLRIISRSGNAVVIKMINSR